MTRNPKKGSSSAHARPETFAGAKAIPCQSIISGARQCVPFAVFLFASFCVRQGLSRVSRLGSTGWLN